MSNELFDGMGRGWRKVVRRGAMDPSTPGSLTTLGSRVVPTGLCLNSYNSSYYVLHY